MPINGSLASLALRTTGCPVGQAMDANGVCQWVYDVPEPVVQQQDWPTDIQDILTENDITDLSEQDAIDIGILPPTPDNPIIDQPPDVVVPPVVVPPPVVPPPVVPPPVVPPVDVPTQDVSYPPGYDPIWDTEDIPAGASFEVRRGLLPTSTPTFNIHNPYYYDDDYIAERWYSGSYGWRLPGGSGINAPSGSFDPYNPWGGEDRRYDIGSYGDEPAFGTNLTPYSERWFIGGGLLPESYGSYVENIIDGVGTIPGEAGLVQPTITGSYDIQPPKELTLWGEPYTATSNVGVYSDPEFIHPYYDWVMNSLDELDEESWMDDLDLESVWT